MSQIPITYTENVSLTSLGVNQANINFSSLTLESDKYICICDRTQDPPQAFIVDVANSGSTLSYNIKADSARMNPSLDLIALKSGTNIQVYSHSEKRKIKGYQSPEEITYWRWISSNAIVIVTTTSVYRWTTDDTSVDPVKIFDRQGAIVSSQIMSYKFDSKSQWSALVGITGQNNQIVGSIQLYSAAMNLSQNFEGFACIFADVLLEGNSQPSSVFAFISRSANASKLSIVELQPVPTGNTPFPKNMVDVPVPPDAAQDYPFSMHHYKNSGIIFIVSKMGYNYLYELESGACLFVNRLSQDIVFVSADLLSGEGFIAVNKRGSVFSISINKDNIVPYLVSKKMDAVAYKLALRVGFPGAEGAIVARFNEYFNRNQFVEAARIAARTTSTSLRNVQTIARFQAASSTVMAGQSSPILIYFTKLIEESKLNAVETLEFCKPLFQQNKINFVKKCLQDNKFECTEELGDLARSSDLTIALSIYLHAKAHARVIQVFAEMGEFKNIFKYAEKVGYSPDYLRILRSLCQVNPESAENFAKTLLQNDASLIDLNAFAACFVECGLSNQCIAFLIEALKGDKPEHADLQTKLLEMALVSNPTVAQTILNSNILSHFDKPYIAKICEQAGLIHFALQYYTELYDIQRAIVQTHLVDPEWLVSYFGSLSVDDTSSCLKVLLENNRRQNLGIVVKVATKYHEQLGDLALISLFESCKSPEGLFMFLSSIVNYSQDPEVHFKYVQATVKTGQFKELERICKESNCFDAEKVKNFLKEAKLSDQSPLIIVCDRFDYVEDLVLHFHKNDLLRYIEIYVTRVNSGRLPKIVGALLDVDCSEDFIRNLMMTCPPNYNMTDLVEEVSQRNRIKLLRPVIESRISAGSVNPGDHTALAIVYIDSNNRPESFLRENPYYDPLVVGKYCENRDPNLACLSYERGKLDEEMIRVCLANSLYKNLARYVILRSNPELWAKVLDASNDYRRSFIEQASQSVLSESYDPELISQMVKAFMSAHLASELIDLLEKIVFGDSPHKTARNLQNLLLLTALKSDPSRVIDYVNRLDNYDAPNIASVAINYKLFEEAFCIFKKFKVHASAVQVLAEMIGSLDRAYEYAERCNVPDAWSILGKAQLVHSQPREAIDSFIKANDPSHYVEVINTSHSSNIHEAMVKYLTMVRSSIRDSTVDSEFAYCLAQTHRYDQLQDFLNQPHNINIIPTGDRLFDEGQYESAKVFYKYATNFPKLAATHVQLKEYQQAVEMARKANNTKMWKLVCNSCLKAHEYKFAQVCALNLVVHPEELEELVIAYEEMGLFQELVSLIEASVNLERAHMGIFTELSILYAKYKPARLREHLELYYTRINIPKVLRAIEVYKMWHEMVFLHDKYEEYDNAILTMIRHPGAAFNEPQFRDIIQKVANQDLYHKAISFYYEYKPLMLNDLMIVLSPRIDHAKAITQLKKIDVLPMCKTYLVHAQRLNVPVINEALNSIYIEEEAYEDLSNSIEMYNNYDAIKLSDELADHPSIEMRRISTRIRKLSNRWGQTLEMAKKDECFDDAIIYAAESRDPSIAQSLLDHFIELKRPDLVVSILYFCYDILKPDNVLETCWVNGMTDYCMPYMIQTLKECTLKIDFLEAKTKKDLANEQETPQQSEIFQPQPRLMLGSNSGAPNHFSPPVISNRMMAQGSARLPHNPFK